ncbi:Encapsulation protein CapA [Sulfitobacter donghicola DSW-25 = KCTC 12864 = JCM 14565]|nr:Encapsulation protein CapA [Sulfitobacter donghicola DSW-25 = KCTC 12864 = JCM 14565]
MSLALVSASDAQAENPYLPTKDVSLYLDAIEKERPNRKIGSGATGILVPHHLVAADLIARGFWAASEADYDTVILMSPDHFRAVEGEFATTRASFETIFGQSQTNQDHVSTLMGQEDLFELLSAEELAMEHGFQAVVPFVKHFFPEAKIVPILASISAKPKNLQALADLVLPMMGPRTLFVQSTDFSHYLDRRSAVLKDQESISVIAARDADLVVGLEQPRHLDSKASLTVHMQVQKALGAHPLVIANRNQAEYGGSPDNTTSYVTAVWSKDPSFGYQREFPDQKRVYFAGDVLLGRYLQDPLTKQGTTATETVKSLLPKPPDAPFVINLEGVLLDEIPVGAPNGSHVMVDGIASPLLKGLSVVGASLANNHTADFGDFGLNETIGNLNANNIHAMQSGEVYDLGPLRIIPLTLLRNNEPAMSAQAISENVQKVCNSAAPPPLIVFIHWGAEWTNTASQKEHDLASRFADCGVSAVVGHHSHQASKHVKAINGGAAQMVYSLGNFIFDQTGPKATGAMLEVTVFNQSTIFSRLVPIPNFFERLQD